MAFSTATAIDQIRDMLRAPKHFSEWPYWIESSESADGEFSFLTGMAVDGVSVAGVRLRGIAPFSPVNRDVRIQLDCLIGSRWVHVSRFEFRPVSGHSNPFDERDFPRKIAPGTCHAHLFSDNSRRGLEAFDPRNNLPLAVPLDPQPSSFNEFLAYVADELGLEDLRHISAPPWQERLL
jgi:hypothetical protein